jgi:hypothetical protein
MDDISFALQVAKRLRQAIQYVIHTKKEKRFVSVIKQDVSRFNSFCQEAICSMTLVQPVVWVGDALGNRPNQVRFNG